LVDQIWAYQIWVYGGYLDLIDRTILAKVEEVANSLQFRWRLRIESDKRKSCRFSLQASSFEPSGLSALLGFQLATMWCCRRVRKRLS